MKVRLDKLGFSLIEFFLSIVTLFLLMIITYPILQKLTEQNEIRRIKENLNQIRNYSDQFFKDNNTDSVSLYEFIGPRKAIPKLEFIADEKYPQTIFRKKEISAFSIKYGTINVH